MHFWTWWMPDRWEGEFLRLFLAAFLYTTKTQLSACGCILRWRTTEHIIFSATATFLRSSFLFARLFYDFSIDQSSLLVTVVALVESIKNERRLFGRYEFNIFSRKKERKREFKYFPLDAEGCLENVEFQSFWVEGSTNDFWRVHDVCAERERKVNYYAFESI